MRPCDRLALAPHSDRLRLHYRDRFSCSDIAGWYQGRDVQVGEPQRNVGLARVLLVGENGGAANGEAA